MTRVILSILVGIVCAVLLTLIRGGWRDAPYIPLVFATGGFTIAYGIVSIIRSAQIAAIDLSTSRHRGWQLVRNVSALTLAGGSIFWSGRVVQEAGFGGWLIALLLGILLPLLTCLLAAHAPIIFGLLSATSLAVSTLLHHPDFRRDPFALDAWSRFIQQDWGVWAVIWGILVGLSLLVSVPVAIQRRLIATRDIGSETPAMHGDDSVPMNNE